MFVYPITEPDITENCPVASLEGFHEPNDNQLTTLLARGNSGRLIPSLRDDSVVQWSDAIGTLAAAAIFRLLEVGAATADPRFGGLGNPDLPLAIADLAVTGVGNYADFRRVATESGSVDIPALRRAVMARLVETAERLNVTLDRGSIGETPGAVDYVVDRALRVVWALYGTVSHRSALRPTLDWIACTAERDRPGRPVNIPAASWPIADLQVPIIHNSVFFDIRVRYSIAGGSDAVPTTLSIFDELPDTSTPPIIPDDALVVIFLHGHSSSLEEAVTLYPSLVAEQENSIFRRSFVMIAFDFPTNGYSDHIDHDTLSPLGTTTNFSPDRPLDRRFGMLEFYERFVERFVDVLHDRMTRSGQPGITHRIAAVIGGSMGGNLALRLSERLVSGRTWLDALVAWSPASAYGSFGRFDSFIPSPGEESDPFGKEALDRPHERCQAAESDDSRADFLRLQLQGERLINDGTTGFEVGIRLITFFLQPLVGGLAPVVLGPVGPLVSGLVGPVVLGSATLEGVANIIAVKQSDEWLREECRASWDAAAAARGAGLTLHEHYSSERRRMHWRIAYEQLLFSHQDEVAASRGVPCYEASTVPTLLIAGVDDVVDRDRFNIFGGVRTIAPLMTANQGWTRLLASTGHSIHAERPRWLAREIYKFIGQRRPRAQVVAVHREDGRITALEFGPFWKPMPVSEAIRIILQTEGPSPFYLVGPDGRQTQIIARRYLTTAPDEHLDNNLRSLPMTSLPLPEDDAEPAPPEGFQVTHIRVRYSAPARPDGSWVSHLCNDALGLQVGVHSAEIGVANGYARYLIRTDAGDNDLILAQYLTTSPDDTVENNLASLPDA